MGEKFSLEKSRAPQKYRIKFLGKGEKVYVIGKNNLQSLNLSQKMYKM